jgi:hypothetical protein
MRSTTDRLSVRLSGALAMLNNYCTLLRAAIRGHEGAARRAVEPCA